jgi:hypothetical protein
VLVQLWQILTSSSYTSSTQPQTGRLEQLDLRLDEEVERDFRHEQARTRAGRVADGGADVLIIEVLRRLDARERVSEDVVEDVVDPRAAGELFRGDVDVRAFDGGDKVACESGHEAENECALLW